MQRSILVDLNVILDVLLERPGYKASQKILEEGTNRYTIFISEHIVTTFAYLLKHANVPHKEIKRNISWLLNTFSVVTTSNDILKNALKSSMADYEDVVIKQAAVYCKASAIVTRNIKDFTHSAVPAFTPENFT